MGKGTFSFDDKEKHEGEEYVQKPGKPSAGRAAGDVSPEKGASQDLSDKKIAGENVPAFGDEKEGELSEQTRGPRKPSANESAGGALPPERGLLQKVSGKKTTRGKGISAESQQNPADSFEETWRQPDFRTAVIRRALAIIRGQVHNLEAKREGGVLTMGEVQVWKDQLQQLEEFALKEVGGERKRLLREIEQLKVRLKGIESKVNEHIRERVQKEANDYATGVYRILDRQVENRLKPLWEKVEKLGNTAPKRQTPAWQLALAGLGGFVVMLIFAVVALSAARKTGHLAWVTPTALVTSTPTTSQAFTPTAVVVVRPSPAFTPTLLSAPPSPTPTFTPVPLPQWGIAQLVTALRDKDVPARPCVSPQQAPAQGQASTPSQGRQGCFAFRGNDLAGLPPAPDLTGVKELAFQLKPGTNELELVVSDLSGKENGKASAPTLKKYAPGTYILNSSVPQDEYLCVKTNISLNQLTSEQPKINIQIGGASQREAHFDFPLPTESSGVYCVLLKRQYGQYMMWQVGKPEDLQPYTWWLIPLQAKK